MKLTRDQLIQWEIQRIQAWLDCFDGPRARVGLMPSGQTIYVRGYPLPDGYRPDRLDLAIVVNNYPAEPPIGAYALSTSANASLIGQLRAKFNIFDGGAAHGAPPIEGFQWLCVGYLNGWRFNATDPAKGDTVLKHLINFRLLLEQ